MKIAIIAWRHWSAGRRFRSLALNAKRLGHQVWGFASNHHGDMDLSLTAFKELSIEAYPGDQFKNKANELNFDATFGEHLHVVTQVELDAQEWAQSHPNKVAFSIPERITRPQGMWGFRWGPHNHHLVTNTAQVNKALEADWPKDQIHIIGCPDFDFVNEPIDVAEVRNRLGAQPGQPLIGFFPNCSGDASYSEQTNFMQIANQQGWRVVVHVHSQVRRVQNIDTEWGFYWSDYPSCKMFQDHGAHLIADYAPGTIKGIIFHRCQSFELLGAADALVIESEDPAWEAYALKKHCHLFVPRISPPDDPLTRILDSGFENGHSVTDKVLQTLARSSNSLVQNPQVVEEWFYKLDGLWWQRALDLAHQLTSV